MVAASLVGSIPGWLTFAGLIYVARIFYKGGGGAAIQTLQIANQVLETNGNRLEARVKELEAQAKKDGATIVELRAKTDVAEQLRPIADWTAAHEKADQVRFDHTLQVLEQIARYLGKEEAA